MRFHCSVNHGVILILLLILFIPPARGQNEVTGDLRRLDKLTGIEYKVVGQHEFRAPYLFVGLQGGFFDPLQPGTAIFGEGMPDSIQSRIYEDPRLFDMLMEKLGGEFMIGDMEGKKELSGTRITPDFQYGVDLGRFLVKGLSANLGFDRSRHNLSGEFKVTVFPEGQSFPDSAKGKISSDITFQSLNVGFSYFFTRYNIWPFLSAGFTWQWYKLEPFTVKMAGESFQMEESGATESHPGVLLNAGACWNITDHWSVHAGANYRFIFAAETDYIGTGYSVFAGLIFKWKWF